MFLKKKCCQNFRAFYGHSVLEKMSWLCFHGVFICLRVAFFPWQTQDLGGNGNHFWLNHRPVFITHLLPPSPSPHLDLPSSNQAHPKCWEDKAAAWPVSSLHVALSNLPFVHLAMTPLTIHKRRGLEHIKHYYS